MLEGEDVVAGQSPRENDETRDRKRKREKTVIERRRVGRPKRGVEGKGRRLGGRDGLAPLLEETHPLTLAIGAPEVATAAGAVAAVLRPVVAATSASYAGSPIQVYQRGTSTRD